jgi:putative transposase
MKPEGHFHASGNAKWTDWPFSSAAEYIEYLGREQALKFWQSYPLFDYGKNWDRADL